MKKLVCAILFIASTASAGEIIRRGEAIPAEMPRVPLADVLAKPDEFTTRPFVTEGVVEKVCWIAGCWMNVAPASGKPGIHVTFKDGAFVVPRSSGGQHVRLLGKVRVTEKKASFVASGVELLPSLEH
ncbi:MAG: DUF4920 domain-containing protein [Thermoanaerobaculia bacterium]